KNILITGGGGFIGVAMATRLCEDNQVVLFDTDFEHNAFAFSELKNNVYVQKFQGDILDKESIDCATREAQIVIHMAAKVGVQEVISDSLNTLEVNYGGTSNLLKSLANNQNCERVLVFSTSEVFGVRAFGIAESGDSTFASVQDIRWCYCVSKLAAEQLAFSYFRQKGLPAVVIRPFNIFGPDRVGDHVVLRFIMKALRNEDLEVYGDGTQIRAWCYIDDFCDGVLRAMEVPEAIGQAFNIGNQNNTITIQGLAREIIELCGSKSRIVFKSLDFTDIDLRVPNTSKARNMLGFVPKVDLGEGLTRTINWVSENMDKIDSRVVTKRKYVV
ncbi:MAG: NAD-dependent epimerase/dehydratase family protein, partial [Dehalococcoidales bacterium]|nr:NAD-dependent epimerase/dehydratase family protein [Dehalococcoidales bacterium]